MSDRPQDAPQPPPTPPTPPWYARYINPARILSRRLGPAAILTLLAATLPLLGVLLVAASFVKLSPWLQSHTLLGILIYVLTFWLLGGLAVIPTWVHSGLGGLAFGFAAGYPAALVSFLGASLVAYAIAYHASGDRVTKLISEHPKSLAVYNALLRSGFCRSLIIITLIRITPTSPFAVTNVIMAATRAPLLPFILGTLLGLGPRTAAVVYTASQAHKLDVHNPYETAFFIAGLLAIALALLLIIILSKRALAQMTNNTTP